MLLVLACGIAFAAYRLFWWPPPEVNATSYLAAYLALLTTTSLGSFFARPSWRRPCQGFAFFNWCNFVFIIWALDGSRLTIGGWWTVQGCWMGVVLGVLCALVAGWLFEPPSGGPRPA